MEMTPAAPATTPVPAGTSASTLEYHVDGLLSKVLAEIDERDFTGDDFMVLAQRVQEMVLVRHDRLSALQQKSLVLKVLRRVADHVLPKIADETARTVINLLLLSSGTLFDVLHAAFLKKFDVDGDGEVTPEEFNAVCAACCCVPKR
jgi:hypothetical protein